MKFNAKWTKNKKETQKPVEKQRFELVDKFGLGRRIEHSTLLLYDMNYNFVVDADKLEALLQKAFSDGQAMANATGEMYAKFNHKEAVSKKELQEALSTASEDLKIFKSSDILASLSKRISEAGIK